MENKIIALNGIPRYSVSPRGMVTDLIKHRILANTPQGPNKSLTVRMADDRGRMVTRKVSRLVAELYVDRPEGTSLVGFIDGDMYNVCADNLYWYGGGIGRKA